MIIREVEISDAYALSEIYKYYVDNFSYSFEYVAPTAEEFVLRISDITKKFPFFICENNNEIIGFAYAHQFKERKAYQWVCETSIYIKNGCTKKGVGTILYEKLLPVLKQQGFVKVFAGLGCPNEGSELFHQKMGFSLIATIPEIGYKLGAWHDIKYYVLELNTFQNDMPEPLEYWQIKSINDNKNIFYHASNISGLKELLPLSKIHGENMHTCYFTPNKFYGLFYLRDMEINHVTCSIDENGIPTYHEQFPNQLYTIYKNRSGYIYSCMNDGLIKQGHTNGVWLATEPITVLKSEFIEDVYNEIIKAEKIGKIRVIRYEDLTDEKKDEIIEMMKLYILKNGWLHYVTAKGLFFKTNFPISWQAAELYEQVKKSEK